MSEKAQTATREMLIDKIDAEYAGLQMNQDEDTGLFSYRKESLGHIRDALYNLQVAAELLPAACGRDSILLELYPFWTKHASLGDNAVDKDELGLWCARRWLEDVRSEYRYSLLMARMSAEHADFLAKERLKTPDELIHDAWKISCYNHILTKMSQEDMLTLHIDALLTLRRPLASIFKEYSRSDLEEYLGDIFNAVMETAHLQVATLTKAHSLDNNLDERYVSEYLERYHTAFADEFQETDVPGLEPYEDD